MFDRLSRSWNITKLTLKVMQMDKEIFVYPVFAFILSIAAIVLFILPILFVEIGSLNYAGSEYLVILAFYFVMALISTFFSFCVVYTAKTRFEGGNATVSSTTKYAFGKFGRIVQWALTTAIVGVILNALRNRGKGIGGMIMKLVAGGLEIAWKIATVFSIPAIVYLNLGPFGSIKASVNALKKTWGESITRYLGVNILQGAVNGGVFGIAIVLTMLYVYLGNASALWGVWGVAIIILALSNLFFNIASSVFNTALFYYAQYGKIPEGFAKEDLHNAMETKQGTGPKQI